MSSLWRGTLATQLRIGSGLVLFAYALAHFVNIGLGLVSPEWMDDFQTLRKLLVRNPIGNLFLYGAFSVHAVLALSKLATRRTLRMPVFEGLQIILGLLIPTLLITHIIFTRGAYEIYGVNDDMGYLMVLIWGTSDGWKQSLLLLIVWTHGCIGLHFWLRSQAWWQRWQPVLVGLAALVPAFALAGFMVEGRRMVAAFAQEGPRSAMMEAYNWPDIAAFRALLDITEQSLWAFGLILLLVACVYVGRRLLSRHRSVRVRYIDGPEVSAPKGMTLLEVSRANGIPHAALCGGRGRCTTCRVVIGEGLELLHPPSAAEAQSLAAVGASANTRLACQIRPTEPATVFRVFEDARKRRAHASQGEEKELALLFLDMRGFTARTTGQLPYDVVFLLNRFFDAIVPAIDAAGGSVDKYLGDGFLALFETSDAKTSAQAALKATQGVATALAKFNAQLEREGQAPVAIGIGAHLGDVVLGEIGAAGQAPRTLIGDTVNTASRLEGVTKAHAVQAFLSKPLLEMAGYSVADVQMIALELRGLSEPLLALPIHEASNLMDSLATSTQKDATI
jgi:adenylate cyclase